MGDPTRTERETAPRDGAQGQQPDTTTEDSQSATFTCAGAIPPVLGSPKQPPTSASDLAYGTHSSLPLTTPADLQASADKIEIERLLESGGVTSGQDAIAALDFLLQMSPAERVKIVDRLDDRAFANLLDRLTDDQRARFTPIVEAAQDPKKRLKLWGAQHTSKARNDLQRYKGDFGNGDGAETDAQITANERFKRRAEGVASTEHEVESESQTLLQKKDLSVADVDAMRARKDKELDVEIKHNVNLVAESQPRADGGAVQWSTDEATQLDQALDKVPAEQANGDNSVATYTRRANRSFAVTKGGQYNQNEIDIYDNAHVQPPGRDKVQPVEYAAVHEIGHDAANDNPAAFKKFEKAAGWHQTDKATVEKNADPEDMPRVGSGIEVGQQHVQRDDEGHYNVVDSGALPSRQETGTDRWKYAAASSQEHFAELYAMAVETPELLYADYVANPATHVRTLEAKLRDQEAAHAPEIAATRAELEDARKTAAQRHQLFDIIRNDVFHMQNNEKAAVRRLRDKRISDDQIQTFEQRAARLSTPAQLAGLEREFS